MVQYTKNLSILVVEDDDESRETLSSSLREVFREVTSATNGQEALELYNRRCLYEKGVYDIVLSDIKMPLLNGVELTEKIYDITPEQIVIIMSAYDDSKYLLSLINIGIEYFVKKPINYDEFFNTLMNSSMKISNKNSSIDEQKSNEIYVSESVFFNREKRSLYKNEENIYLTKYEIIFLNFLSQKLDKIYSNEEIVSHFTSLNEQIDMQNIRKLVSKLRKKLPEDSIESVYGIGYKLCSYHKK